ncbi:hypothetical protein OH76DRAFT_404697 [Lentinus brumalis]|uniref:Uncharacterized protein n=1 Tax=Lentinus brumalis TaxID=2498619 RepID=A0A371DVR7_9APHY|nr:hypothetical protein OH76DRAFT_404697 [Polyporus brumalis]
MGDGVPQCVGTEVREWEETSEHEHGEGPQLESFRGRPRFRLGGSAEVLASPAPSAGSGRGFLGGRPLFFFGGGSDGSPPSAFFFLFLLPGGRPRLRLGAASGLGAEIARSGARSVRRLLRMAEERNGGRAHRPRARLWCRRSRPCPRWEPWAPERQTWGRLEQRGREEWPDEGKKENATRAGFNEEMGHRNSRVQNAQMWALLFSRISVGRTSRRKRPGRFLTVYVIYVSLAADWKGSSASSSSACAPRRPLPGRHARPQRLPATAGAHAAQCRGFCRRNSDSKGSARM